VGTAWFRPGATPAEAAAHSVLKKGAMATLFVLVSLAPLAIALALDSLRVSPSQIPLVVRPSPRPARRRVRLS
jgi:hypothetical protein